MAVITNVSNEKSNLLANQDVLKSIFETVDTIKADLTDCIHFGNNDSSYKIISSDSKNINFGFVAKEKSIQRKFNKENFTTIISNVTDFYLKFFPENKSVLYRIEVGNKEQIRGYVFLRNLKEIL